MDPRQVGDDLMKQEIWWEDCAGCFNSQYIKGYGPCEGCVGINDFQLKSFKILNKIFSVEENKLVQNQKKITLEDDERKFLINLITYNKRRSKKNG